MQIGECGMYMSRLHYHTKSSHITTLAISHRERFSNSQSQTSSRLAAPSIIWQQFIKYRISRGAFLSNALPRASNDDVRRSTADNKSINNSLPPQQVTHRNNKLFASFRQRSMKTLERKCNQPDCFHCAQVYYTNKQTLIMAFAFRSLWVQEHQFMDFLGPWAAFCSWWLAESISPRAGLFLFQKQFCWVDTSLYC